MKSKTLLVAGLMALGLAAGAQASDGVISINGKILATTCKINGGTPAIAVPLPTVSKTQCSPTKPPPDAPNSPSR